MPVTIYDVAKKAGVGIGTVSRALNNSPQILPETKARILQIAQELNYQPHALAQGLARRKTGTIAVIVPFFLTYFFIEMLKGIQHELTQYQYDLILYSVDQKEKLNTFLKRTLQEKRVDGVLLCSLSISTHFAEKFIEAGSPIVLLDTFHPLLDSITIENELGAYQATLQLIQAGHRKIGMINAPLISRPARLRYKGFKKALLDAGIEFKRKYLMIGPRTDESDGFTREAGYQAMKQLLTNDSDRPTGLFISSDIQAIGAIQALQEQQLSSPTNMSIVSFDDIELAEYFGLTTMRQPIYEMGKLAVQRLVEKLSAKGEAVFQKKIIPELIIRKSCAILSTH